MKEWKNHRLSPQNLAWIELTDASGLLPLVWYGYLSGTLPRPMTGLRQGTMARQD